MQKMAKVFFFLKLTFSQLPNYQKDFPTLFDAFESQDKMLIEYISVKMLMFLKNSITRC